MKISKLFHWLYALVMLLPIFAIGTTCLISTFNMSGKEETEITYKYDTNEVNSTDDLIVGNVYSFSVNTFNQTFVNEEFYLHDVLLINNFYIESDSVIGEYDLSDYELNLIFFAYNGTDLQFTYGLSKNDFYGDSSISWGQVSDLILDVVFIYDINDDFVNGAINFVSSTNYNEIQSVETHNLQPEDIFYRSVEKVENSPLFSWAYDSFLVAPFSYIVNLFGMPTNHVVVELLSYWLAISIIWLVFDLVMYVPLLVHRWLDKGVLE